MMPNGEQPRDRAIGYEREIADDRVIENQCWFRAPNTGGSAKIGNFI
jgi:hypothetical protein